MPRKRRRRAEPSPLVELVAAAEQRPLTAEEAVELRAAIIGGETARRSNGGLQAALQEARDEAAGWIACIQRGFDEHMQFSVLKPDGSTEQLPCADWCYACKLANTEAERDRLAAGVPLVCSDERHDAKVRGLVTELARFHEGEEPHEDPLLVATPAQWIWLWNRATPEERLHVAASAGRNAAAEKECRFGHQIELHELRQRPTPDEYKTAYDGFWDHLKRAQNAEGRLELARDVLIRDGYFTDEQVGPDIAPRLTEWLTHHHEQTNKLRAALTDVLSRFEDNGVRAYLGNPSINSRTMARWRAVLDQSEREQPAVVHPETEQQASEPPTVDEKTPPAPGLCHHPRVAHTSRTTHQAGWGLRTIYVADCPDCPARGESMTGPLGLASWQLPAEASAAPLPHRPHNEDGRPAHGTDDTFPYCGNYDEGREYTHLTAVDSEPDSPVDNPGPEIASPQANQLAAPDNPEDTGTELRPVDWSGHQLLPRRKRLRPGLIEQMITAAREQGAPDVDVRMVIAAKAGGEEP
jgi:hypothetical protein